MLKELCEELGIIFCGPWPAVGGFLFMIDNPKLVCYGTTFVARSTDKETLIKAVYNTESKWINKERKEVDIYV